MDQSDEVTLDQGDTRSVKTGRGVFFVFFFSGEGPRNRRYGRTAALRLIVQPCDEDDDHYFLSFS
jgi:hypothetical protein